MITPEQADQAYTILCREAGAYDDPRGYERYGFVHYVTSGVRCIEWRFQGKLGFGGKFRDNGNKPTPFVDCYSEDMTPERRVIIARTNAALAELFATPPTDAGAVMEGGDGD